MTYQLIHGDARHVSDHVAAGSVDLLITSPPYFALRSYQDGGEHYDGQIGSEPTPTEFLDALVDCTRDWLTVMRPTGSLWVNLGDKYSQRVAVRRSSHQDGLFPERDELRKDWKRDKDAGLTRMPYQNVVNHETGQHIPEKSLMGLPWRYAIRCIDELGLILRAEVIWSKPNGLPEPVTDRVRRSHEQWFHFSLQPRYFAAVDEIREPHAEVSVARSSRARLAPDMSQVGVGSPNTLDPSQMCNPLGKLPGSVWTVPTEPLQVPDHLGVDHFAAFPSEWPRRLILGWSPSGYCTVCDQPRRPVVDKEYTPLGANGDGKNRRRANVVTGGDYPTMRAREEATITGYACDCPTPDAPTRPAVVLDPFGGTGTVAGVAHALGRHGIHIDLSNDYLRLAQWRIEESGLVARAQERSGIKVPKPPAIDGQLDMFGGAA